MRMLAIVFALLSLVFLLGYGGTPDTEDRTVSDIEKFKRGKIDMRKFSDKGVGMLKVMEGFKEAPYQCSAGHPTIGYGHKLKKGENIPFITEEGADILLRQDVDPIEKFINVHLNGLVSQNQFDALVMFIFNIGTTAFLNSQVFEDLKRQMYDEATKPWSKWINVTKEVVCEETGEMIKKLIPVEGLINRRKMEIQLFNA